MNFGIRGTDIGVVPASSMSNWNVPVAQFGIFSPSVSDRYTYYVEY